MTEQEICGLFRDCSLYLFEGQDSYGGRNPILNLLHREYKTETKRRPEFDVLFEIPDLNIKYPIFEGTGNTQLNEGIGHMTETAGLCGKGNCVLAGHNGSRRGVYFTYLCNIEAVTRVKLTNKKRETHEYMAQEMRVVSPYDEWVTEESDDEILTLFTCASHGARRFAVKCVPVSKRGDADGQPVQTGRN